MNALKMIAGCILLVWVVTIVIRFFASFTPRGVAAGDLIFCLHRGGPTLKYNIGSLAARVQSKVYRGETRGIFSVLQSAGARMVLMPFVGKILLFGVCAASLYYFVIIR